MQNKWEIAVLCILIFTVLDTGKEGADRKF